MANCLSISLVSFSSLVFSSAVFSNSDQVRINEVMAGYNGDSSIQFIELLTPDNEQKHWGPVGDENNGRAMLLFFNSQGLQTGRFVFPSHAPVGGNTVLIATKAFAALPEVAAPDFIMPAEVIANSGKVCFTSNPDNSNSGSFSQCISYGANSSVDSGEGTPVSNTLAIMGSSSLSRNVNFDFNSSTSGNADFVLQAPTPSNTTSVASEAINKNQAASGVFAFVAGDMVAQGKTLFEKETFGGNGRTCQTCHVPPMFNMTPKHVKEKLPNDPLFVGHQDLNVNSLSINAVASQPSDLRGVITDGNGNQATVLSGSGSHYLVIGGHGLTGTVTDAAGNSAQVKEFIAGDLAGPNTISGSVNGLETPQNERLTTSQSLSFPDGRALVHENIDGFDKPENFRKSPALINLKETAPFGLSGEFADLASFSQNAIKQHATKSLQRRESVDFRLATDQELAALVAFQESNTLSASANPGELPLKNVTTLLQRRGETEFFSLGCSNCHFGSTLSTTNFSGPPGSPNITDVSFNTGVANQSINLLDTIPSESPESGHGSSNRAFNTPQLIGARFTAPYFHDNSASSLADVVEFYLSQTFKDIVPGLPVVEDPTCIINPFFPRTCRILSIAGALDTLPDLDPELKLSLVAFMKTLSPFPVSFKPLQTFGRQHINDAVVVEIPITNVGDKKLTITHGGVSKGFLTELRVVDLEHLDLFTIYPFSFEQRNNLFDFPEGEVREIDGTFVFVRFNNFVNPPVSSQFQIEGNVQGIEIAPGETKSIAVRFTPTTQLTHISGQLQLTLNDGSEDWDIGIRLTGGGFGPEVDLESTDTTPPTITENPIVVEATGEQTFVEVPADWIVDDSGKAVNINPSLPSSGLYALGFHVWDVMAQDHAGNTIYESLFVDVRDTTPPVFTTKPQDMVVQSKETLTVVELFPPIAEDIFGIREIFNDAPSEGFPIGTHTVTWTAFDNNWNSNTITQSVTVTKKKMPKKCNIGFSRKSLCGS